MSDNDVVPLPILEKPPIRRAFEALRWHFGDDEAACDNPQHIDDILRQYGFTVVPLDQSKDRD